MRADEVLGGRAENVGLSACIWAGVVKRDLVLVKRGRERIKKHIRSLNIDLCSALIASSCGITRIKSISIKLDPDGRASDLSFPSTNMIRHESLALCLL